MRAVDDAAREDGFAFLLDNRRRWPAASPEHVREMAWEFARLDAAKRPSRVAIVAERDVSFGLARMFSAHADDLGIDAEAFRDLDEAESWIRSHATRKP